MAKAGFYLYGTKGKVGNIVARKGRKGTVLAERKFSIKNPRTNKQMAQRIILATVAQAAKYLSPIVDHSFEGVAIGQLSKERFRKLNMNRLRKIAANDFATEATGLTARAFTTTKNTEALIPNSYIISRGSLADSKLRVETDATGNTKFNVVFQDCTIPLADATAGQEKITLGDAIKQIFGLSGVNEQLTFVAIQKTGENYKYAYGDDPDNPGMMIPYTGMVARRMFLDPSVDLSQLIVAEIGPIQSAIEAAFNVSKKTDQALTSVIAEIINDFDYEVEGSTLKIRSTRELDFTQFNSGEPAQTPALGYVYALGIIRSKLMENNTWQLSNSEMVLGNTTADGDSNFGIYWNGAIAAWFEGSTVADDAMYLEAGTDENTIGESFT